jgi:CubicO group peptidase (beta-lactamase class C family)
MIGVFVCSAVLRAVGAGAAQEPDSLAIERVVGETGTRVDAQLEVYAAAGYSGAVLVVREGRMVLLKGYGLANLHDSIPNTPATRFEMNSMAKMFTAASILQLAGAGRLALDDPVERYLGRFPAGEAATVRHLAMHTAGLIPQGTPLNGNSRDEFIDAVRRAPRESGPGERYRYTNAGYSLLAAIVERVSGESYESYLRRHLFAPAGMRSALFRFEVPASDSRFARGYVAGPSGPEPGPANPYVWGTIGAGGVWCTVGDMYRWLVFVESGEAIPTQFRPLLFAPPPAPSLEAFGWHYRARTDSSRTSIDKGGGSDDFASQMLYYPEERVVIIWTSNDLSKRWRQTLNRAIPDLVFSDRTEATPPRGQWSP